MTQATGSNSQLLIVKEAIFGVTPSTPNYALLNSAVYGESINSSSEELVSNQINSKRSIQRTRNGMFKGSGSIPIEFGNDSTDLLLEGIAGSKSGAGTSVSPYVFKRGSSLPSFSIEKGFKDIGQYFTFTGNVFNQLDLNFEAGQNISGTVSTISKGEVTNAQTSADASPSVVSFENLTGIDTNVYINNVLANVPSINFSITNGATEQAVLGSKFAKSINAGTGETTGSITVLFEDESIFDAWLNESISTIKIECIYNSKSIVFEFNSVKYNAAGVPNIETAEGVLYTLNWRAVYNATDDSDFKITMINQ